jgi:hypothetical protein
MRRTRSTVRSALLFAALLGCGPNRIVSGGAGGAGGGGSSGSAGAGGSAPTVTDADLGFRVPDGSSVLPDAALPAACAAQSYKAMRLPLDIVMLVDQSPSMLFTIGARTKWDLAREALRTFLRDPRSAGIGVGLQFLPVLATPVPCQSDVDCGTLFACAGPNGCEGTVNAAGRAQRCDLGAGGNLPDCPRPNTCQPLGRCAQSGRDCTAVGMPCPGGAAGDSCVVMPRTCSGYPIPVFPSCAPADYVKLAVPIGELPASQDALVRAMDMRNPNPNLGFSPIGNAAQGVFDHLHARLMANPGRRVVMVLVTDGVGGGCFFGWNTAETLERGLAGELARSISTYIIGLFSESREEDAAAPAALRRFAVAGGTKEPFLIRPPDDAAAKLTDALNQIRAATLPCEYAIPAPAIGTVDFMKVNLHFRGASGEEDIPYVGRAERCDPVRGGWYYDVDPASGKPMRMLACDATCRRFKTDERAEVSIAVGCATRVIE